MPGGATETVLCGPVVQRAWSRTATAHDASGRPVFLKQFVTRSGAQCPQVMAAERAGAALAAEVFRDLDVSLPSGADAEALVLAYPWRRMTPLDELLRRDPARFEAAYDTVLRACAAEIGRCRDSAAAGSLSEKRTAGARLGVGVVFKAFELRNVAVPDPPGRPVAFDLGQPRRGPVEEAGARVFVSAALLNWGRPIRRFARGPQPEILGPAWQRLQPLTTSEACLAELDHQYRTRTRDDRLTYGASRHARRAVLRVLGARYRRQVRSWVQSQ